METWQQLLSQAFRQTPLANYPANILGIWWIRRYIYRVLQNAGIENRSPFTLLQLFSIHKLSQGDPQQVRELCINTVETMHKPASGFQAAIYLPFVLVLLLLAFIMLPKSATTFPSADAADSILRQPSIPPNDIDTLEIVLPTTTDYLTAASLYVQQDVPGIDQEKGPFGSAWIREQEDSAYSLQIFSASNIDNLLKFCRQHQICEASSWYLSEVNGKKLYRLLYGVYHNHQAAKIAKSQLPRTLQHVSPWARKFKTIKSEL